MLYGIGRGLGLVSAPGPLQRALPVRLPEPGGDSVHFLGKAQASRTRAGVSKPRALQPGDTIAIVSPATPVSRKELKNAMDYLKGLGFKVVNYSRTDRHKRHYLSDTDKNRADAMNRAFRNPNVKAIFSIQGGGGSFRPAFLNHLDWKAIRANPKIVTGFSDITFLLNALYQKGNMVTVHGNFPSDEPGSGRDTEVFWSLVRPENPALPPAPLRGGKDYRCFVPGVATGELVGGNLALLATAVGSPYETDLRGKILVIEDWREGYEGLDRYFSQLVHNGLWDKINGLIIGDFVDVPWSDDKVSLSKVKFFREMVREARKRGIPVGYNFPIGHGRRNRPWPLGIQVQFDSTRGTLTYLEAPFQS